MFLTPTCRYNTLVMDENTNFFVHRLKVCRYLLIVHAKEVAR